MSSESTKTGGTATYDPKLSGVDLGAGSYPRFTNTDCSDAADEIDNYGKNPMLSLEQAANILGKSLRAMERSVLGRWGNKLPEGWVAKKIKTDHGDEWRILPPPGFPLRDFKPDTTSSTTSNIVEEAISAVLDLPSELFSTQIAKKRQNWGPESSSMEHAAIVIDRTDEVEHLLRELLASNKALADQRKLHLEDLRLMTQMQNSMRLLETSASENARAKDELAATKKELERLKKDYLYWTNLPWWKRIFSAKPLIHD